MKENKIENKKIKIKTYFLCALSVMIMLSGTALAGTLLETATAPEVGITATVIGPLSGSLEIALKSAPETLNIGQTDYIKFYVTNNYPEMVKVTPVARFISAIPFPDYIYTFTETTVINEIITSDIRVLNPTETVTIDSISYADFMDDGFLVNANSTIVLSIPVTMSGNPLMGSNNHGGINQITLEDGISMDFKLVVNVEEI